LTTFVNVRVVAGSRSPTGRRDRDDDNSPIPCRTPAVLCRGLEKSLSERHGRSTAWYE
jgi:hypothetical protein